MAIEEESFYNVIGEEINRTNLVEQMINYYALKLEVGETRVTDFNEGSEIRNLLEAFAVDLYYLMEDQNELSMIAFVETAEGEWLDKHGANPFVQIERDLGQMSTGFVEFTIPSVSSVDIVIPEETLLVSEETGLEYATDSEIILPVGETSITASVTCLTTGEDGNADKNTITIIDDDFLNVPELSVNNPEAFTGGTDYEEDEEYRERLLAYVQKDDFGSLPYYEELGSNIEGVHDVYLVDDSVYTKKILVNGDVKPTPSEILTNVLSEFTDPQNIVVGHTFKVDRPGYKEISLDVNLITSDELDIDLIKKAIIDLFDGGSSVDSMDFDGLSIGETLTRSALNSTFELFDGVEYVQIYLKGESTEVEDIVPGETEVLKLKELNITQTGEWE